MNRHLSADEIALWQVGERDFHVSEHLRTCPQCSAEMKKLSSALGVFGESVRRWSAATTDSADLNYAIMAAKPPSVFYRWRLVPALCALGAASYAVFLYAPVKQSIPNVRTTDAALLDQVDTELSEAVPSALAPLNVSWSGK